MTRQLITIALAASAALALVGCGNSSSTPPPTSTTPTASGTTGDAKPAGGKVHLAFVTNNASDFWIIARKGTEKAAAEMPDVQIDFKIPSDGTAATQKQLVQDLVTTGIDGFAISPVDPKNMTADIDKWADKATVITQDSDAPDSKRVMYIGTDNVAAGRMAGEEVKKAIPNGGKVAVFVGKLDAQNAKERFQGLQEALKGSNVTILAPMTDDTDRVRAKANVSDTLVKTPDVACLVGLWSYNGPAIYNAVKDAKKLGQVKIVCFDSEAETVQGIKDGGISATIVQQPFEFGYQAMKALAAIKKGDNSVIPADKKVIVPTQVIDKASVDEFAKKQSELLGK